MPVDDRIVGAGCVAGLVGLVGIPAVVAGVLWYGLQIEKESGHGSVQILGTQVSYRVVEKNWFGDQVLFCLDENTCIPTSAYKSHLNDLVEKAESDILSK